MRPSRIAQVPHVERTFVVRAEPPTRRNPQGTPERRLTASYSPGELDTMGRLRAQYEAATSPQEAAAAMNSMIVLHEMKCLLDGTVRS